MPNIARSLQQRLARDGYMSEIVSIQHLSDLQEDLEHPLDQETSQKDFYNDIVMRYGLKFHFNRPTDFPTAQSIIITAAPQPKIQVTFTLSGTSYPVIIPPTYLSDTDRAITMLLSQFFHPHGYRVCDAILPVKPLAVHCGLAAYGRNNIAYIDGLGSFFRLRAFFSDMPCPSEDWRPLSMMDRCETCTECRKTCPTHAIADNRFLLDATRCITYLNEGGGDFPEWVEPTWHNCIIGCMICQDNCPANSKQRNWVVAKVEFSEQETLLILEGKAPQKFPEDTREKLQNLCLWHDLGLLQRNLRVLISHPN